MPNRILKESICTSEEIDKLSAFNETVFYRLLVNCDDYGCMDARPKILAAKLFPLKDIRVAQIQDALRALSSAELVILYTVDGKPFLQMKTWDRHQQIRAKKSKFPQASDSNCNQLISDDINCNQVQANDSNCTRNPIQSNTNPNTNPKVRARGEYGWVKLSDEQYEKLVADIGQEETDRCIAYVDESAQGNHNKNKWSDWNLVVRKCHRDGWGKSRKSVQYGFKDDTPSISGDLDRIMKGELQI